MSILLSKLDADDYIEPDSLEHETTQQYIIASYY